MKKRVILVGAILVSFAATASAEAQQNDPAKGSSKRGVRVLKPEPERPNAAVEAAQQPAQVKAEAKPAEIPPAPPPQPTPARVCDRAFPNSDLTLADGRAFDQDLAKLLATKPAALVIDVPERFDPATPPARLQPWLDQVVEGGGSVHAQEISCTRAFGFGKLLKRLFSRKELIHAAVRGYNATLWYEKSSSKVSQIQLTKAE